jgi:hypothetical protein
MRLVSMFVAVAVTGSAFTLPALAGEGGCNWAAKQVSAKAETLAPAETPAVTVAKADPAVVAEELLPLAKKTETASVPAAVVAQ